MKNDEYDGLLLRREIGTYFLTFDKCGLRWKDNDSKRSKMFFPNVVKQLFTKIINIKAHIGNVENMFEIKMRKEHLIVLYISSDLFLSQLLYSKTGR